MSTIYIVLATEMQRRVQDGQCFGSYGWDESTKLSNGMKKHFAEKRTLLNNKIIYSYHAQHYAQSLITKL